MSVRSVGGRTHTGAHTRRPTQREHHSTHGVSDGNVLVGNGGGSGEKERCWGVRMCTVEVSLTSVGWGQRCSGCVFVLVSFGSQVSMVCPPLSLPSLSLHSYIYPWGISQMALSVVPQNTGTRCLEIAGAGRGRGFPWNLGCRSLADRNGDIIDVTGWRLGCCS